MLISIRLSSGRPTFYTLGDCLERKGKSTEKVCMKDDVKLVKTKNSSVESLVWE